MPKPEPRPIGKFSLFPFGRCHSRSRPIACQEFGLSIRQIPPFSPIHSTREATPFNLRAAHASISPVEILAAILGYACTVLGISVMIVGGGLVVFLFVVFAVRIAYQIFNGEL